MNLASLQIKNRFIRSATYEAMASESGEVTDKLVKLYRRLARGGVGLIISGHIYVDPLGRAGKYQIGIHRDELVAGLKDLVNAIHQEGGKIAFQLSHAGRQTTKDLVGRTPLGPSSNGRDPLNFVKPEAMNDDQIHHAINAYEQAAVRAVDAGVDAIQLHAAHGYLINQFLSPFFNERTDKWGSTDENRFRFLKTIISGVRDVLPEGMPLLVKLNTHDHTPKEGITPPLAQKYAQWLVEMNIDGIELSCGSVCYSYMNMSRGEVPVDDFVAGLPWWMKPLARLTLNRMVGKYDLREGYNLEAAKLIKPVVGNVPIILVGGIRNVSQMEEIIEDGYADFISMCRPFIREPQFVNKIKDGMTDIASCGSCNKCLAAVANTVPLSCYNKAVPA
jgi:2,4-dienoyl-CoA reductase-like NADH-dependent reductase (Old Yellow Enzyme family)